MLPPAMARVGQPGLALADSIGPPLLARRLLLLLLHEPLLVRRGELRAVDGQRDLVDLAGERERHLVVLVVDRRAGVRADVQVLVPLENEREGVLHPLARDFRAVDLEDSGAALAEPTVAAEHERRRTEAVVPEVELERVLAGRQDLRSLPLDPLQVYQVP